MPSYLCHDYHHFFSLGPLIYDNETVFNVSNDYKNGISYLSFLRHT